MPALSPYPSCTPSALRARPPARGKVQDSADG